MLYILYLPKTAGEKKDCRKVNGVLAWYTKVTNQKYSIIASPGFLSTTAQSISDYLSGLAKILASVFSPVKIGILNGMNGHLRIKGSPKSILQEHNETLCRHKFDAITLKEKRESDHRKMMCFFKRGNFPEVLDQSNVEDFIRDIRVGAILVGSSNQSRKTYFEEYAAKGEADVFMFDAEESGLVSLVEDKSGDSNTVDFWGNQNSKVFDEIVIAKSFYGRGHSDTQAFLKDILRDVLKNGLDK